MNALVADIAAAFRNRAQPCADNITRCSYDKRNGGELDGPCDDCAEMAEFFTDKSWADISARELFENGKSDGLFTVEAYCYLLPAFLSAALTEPYELDVCLEHLEYRFGPKPEDSWGGERLRAVFRLLTDDELKVCLRYFKGASSDNFESFHERAVANIAEELTRRGG